MGAAKVTVAVATDLHYLSSELRDDGEAFALMTRYSDGAVTKYGDEIFEAFLSDMRQLHPDAVLITGDLTFNGEKKSHEHLAAGFETLWKDDIPVLLFPGNHDINNPLAGSYLGDEALPAEPVTKDMFRRIYSTGSVRPDNFHFYDISSLSFVYALSDDLWLMCTDVNGGGKVGTLTDSVLSWASSVLEMAKSKGIRVIGVTHQDIFPHNQLISAGFVMQGAERLIDLYQKYGVHLNLSGHMHIQHFKEEEGITEIVTSAMMIPPCQYGVLEIEDDIAAYHSKTIDVASWADKSRIKDINLLNFPDYASSFYKDAQRRSLGPELDDLKIDAKTREELIEAMCALNQAFFAGDLEGLHERDSMRLLWQESLPGNFWNDYITSIFDEGIKDERNVMVRLDQGEYGKTSD